MNIFVFGNQDIKEDSLPLAILPKLKEKFPEINFEVKDPNEEWDASNEMPRDITVIDTVVGVREVEVFDNLEIFSRTPNLTMHDFDALSNLRFLQKLGKIKKIKVVGLPPGMGEEEAVKKVSAALSDAIRSSR